MMKSTREQLADLFIEMMDKYKVEEALKKTLEEAHTVTVSLDGKVISKRVVIKDGNEESRSNRSKRDQAEKD